MRISLSVLTLAACSGSMNGGTGTLGASYADAPLDGTSATSVQDSGMSEPLVPSWMRIDGTLTITAGIPDLAASEIIVSGLDLEQVAVCALRDATAFEPVLPLPVDLLSWWEVALTADATCPLPNPVRLGIGPYDALLDPGAAAAGISGTPYGLYTASPTLELWVFGVAGTQANFAGVSAPVTEPPLPDGTWHLESLVLLPL